MEHYLPGYHSKSAHLIYILDKNNENIIQKLNESNKFIPNEKKSNSDLEDNNDQIINYKHKIPKNLEKNVHLIFFSRKFLYFFDIEGKMVKELICIDDNIKFETSDSYHYFLIEYFQKIFDKVIREFNIKVGKYYINLYDFNFSTFFRNSETILF